ncbi:eukaryotic translation initiation factor 1A [Sarcoptes scabiei]|nr:eukaryotic translation initiation factor 1A [Sarcoptes scabiei]
MCSFWKRFKDHNLTWNIENRMPKNFSLRFRRSNSYVTTLENQCQLKARIKIGANYVPVYEINDHLLKSIKVKNSPTISISKQSNRELLFIRISRQGLFISHRPSLDLNHTGSLDRARLLPPSKQLLKRTDTLRSICHRSRSDRCRLIKWNQIDSISSFVPKILIVVLKSTKTDDAMESSQLCYCPHSHASQTNQFLSHLNLHQICFEFLLEDDLQSFITVGVHFQMLEPEPISRSPFPKAFFNQIQKDSDTKSNDQVDSGLISRLNRTKNRMMRWLYRNYSINLNSKI